ncbi:MAG: 5-keto-L-gluconate epimerase [Armatimonadota bacterium]|nr:5-keto-L-gluconate epimerase [Armatimonadota bacterium]MDR5702594.1 5-keto-L-gluconate epimerase [Armatimonadota bacterium]MDR7434138.1 5-keto-L-gluconate epimerase [Armatimonadota bacterium]
MKLSMVVSPSPTTFEAVAFQGEVASHLHELKALGYEGVELAIRDPGSVDRTALRALLDEVGLSVPALGTGQAYLADGLSFTNPSKGVRRGAVARVRAHISLAASLGAMVVIGLIRGKVEETPREQAVAWMLECLKECAQVAEDADMRLVLEPVNRYESNLINTVEEALAVIQEVGSPYLGLLADTFHMNIEEPSIEASLRAAGSLLWHVHIADSNRRAPGLGHLDFPRILKTLREIGYSGYLSAEILPFPDPHEASLQTVRYLKGIMSSP